MDERRQRVVEVARSWLGTRYHHHARVKGAGADCLTLLAEVYHEAGIIGKVEVPYYPPDWNLHRDAERYVNGVISCGAHEIEGPPLPGDIAVFRWGRTFAHGGIVTEWPRLIHAYAIAGRVIEASAGAPPFTGREARFFSLF